MKLRTILLLSALILGVQAASPVAAENQKGVTAPDGEFVAIALRRSSSVGGPPSSDTDSGWLGQRVSFGDKLVWLDGVTCNKWSVTGFDFPIILQDDPNLSDLAIAPLNSPVSQGDQRVGRSAALLCQDMATKSLDIF